MKKIFVLGVGGSPATNYIRSIRSMKEKVLIVGTDSNKYYLQRSEADFSYLAPSCDHKMYFDYLNYIIKKHRLEYVHIQNDLEMQVVSQNREKLKINTFIPSKETVSICMNKYKTAQIWLNAGIKVPKTYLLNTPTDLKKIFDKFYGKIWLREISGAGGKGSLAPKDYNQAKNWIDFKNGWKKFVAAELLTPNSITWMSIWNNGKLIVAQGRKRLYWELSKISPSGITGATGAGVTISDPKLDDIALKSIISIDKTPHGIFSVDLTYDFSGVANPTEINIGRFFTTHEFFTQAGLNMPEIALKLVYKEPLKKIIHPINPLRNGLVWIRGMDFLPVLVHENKINKDIKKMNIILKKIQK
jgi:hypothetical protein